MRELTWPIYVMALSVILVIGMIGYTLRENHAHQRQLAAAVDERQRAVNQFLRVEVCERLELRDEIQLSYLKFVAEDTQDPELRRVLRDAITALEFTQRGCTAELPAVDREGG